MANWLLKRILHLEPVAETELVHSEEELRLILDESAKATHISRLSQEIVANAFEMRRRLVREVMTPRGKASTSIPTSPSTMIFNEPRRHVIPVFTLCRAL